MMYRRLAGKHPTNAAIFAGIGRCSIMMHEYADAERALASAARMEPDNTDHLTNLAYCYAHMGDGEAAASCARRVLALRPGHAPAIRVLADTFRMAGELEAAYRLIEPVARAAGCEPSLVIMFTRLAASIGETREAIDVLESLDRGGVLSESDRASLHYELGGVYDRVGRFDDAWASYELANRLSASSPSIGSVLMHMDALRRAWTSERVRSAPRASVESETPVFIVGMPRSGSSLLEQVLSMCDGVSAGGERSEIPVASRSLLYPEGVLPISADVIATRVDRVRRSSLDRLARQIEKSLRRIDAGASHIIDKNLSNYLYIPLIWMLFPGATIIHAKRNPLDTCVSCYFKNFGPGMEFTNDLASLGAQYRYYDRLMEHWHEVFPGRIVEVVYREFVEDFESQARRVVEAVGATWTDSCLRFYERRDIVATESAEQVRRPLYTSSVGRWRNYEKHLGKLRSALEG